MLYGRIMTYQSFTQMCEDNAAGLDRLAASLRAGSNRESFQALANAWRRIAAEARRCETSAATHH